MSTGEQAANSLQFRVKHTTGFQYETGAVASFNEARMVPLNTPEQYVLRSRLEIKPSPWSYEYTDYWGTSVTAFEVTEPHADLTVVATSVVETRHAEVANGHVEWEALTGLRDEYCEYLAMTDWVHPADELAAELTALRETCTKPADYAAAALALVNQRLTLRPGGAEVTASAAEVWSAGSGSSQDLTHVALGALRHVGIPARYLTGYRHPDSAPQVGDTVSGQSHAWLEFWDSDWIGYDPTYASGHTAQHIVVGRGRDYSDNPPLRGIYATAGGSDMFVAVEITRLR